MEKLKLKCKVVILSTEKADCHSLIKNDAGKFWKYPMSKDAYFTQEYLKSVPATSYHLYLVSDREIKEEDWFIVKDFLHLGLIQATKTKQEIEDGEKILYASNKDWYKPSEVIKIEATTDPSLDLPIIPQSFIKKYVEKEGKIDEVYVKTKLVPFTVIEQGEYTYRSGDDKEVIDTRPDNTVIITKVQDTFTKEDMRQSYLRGKFAEKTKNDLTFEEWFDSNY